MGIQVRHGIYVAILALITYTAWSTYNYIFDTEAPVINLAGIEMGYSYKGDVQAVLSGHDAYKVRNVSIAIDDVPLVSQKSIGRSSFEYPFTVETTKLAQGAHSIKIEAVDGSYSKNVSHLESTFYVDNTPLNVSLIRPVGDVRVFQGKTIHLQFQLNKQVAQATATLFAQQYPCYPVTKASLIWECFIPVPCEQDPGEFVLKLSVEDAVGACHQEEIPLQVIAFPFKTSSLVVDAHKMEKEIEMSRSQQELDDRFTALIKDSPQEKLWHGTFYAPIEIKRKTTDYGVVRTTQLRGRYQHKAVDVINLPRSVVWAPQDGIIVMKDRFAYSGNTIIIDHGYGLFTLLYHLEDFAKVNVGDKVRRGAPVGTLGMTGYASGYHLHWEMRIGNVHVDPEQWIDPAF